ncbi:MAG: type II toxin-antitoxin system RelE/ParE family toxin [Defluviitaleaceae bacterium]|nr:type II toxin-antitoxin system RelE/ParE family toxin [Defluviitaleaceae bacterium]
MIWRIHYTNDAQEDLQGIYDYIAGILLAPEAAALQTNRIMDAADSLGHMPLRHRLHEHDPWHSMGLRFLPVDNYVLFYLPDELQGTVTIVRIMYGSRDFPSHLGESSMP